MAFAAARRGLLAFAALMTLSSAVQAAEPVRVGSKIDTEGSLLQHHFAGTE